MEGGDKVGKGADGGPIATWLNKHRQLYLEATRHPFILSIKHGTIDIYSFKRWLGQDYIFVREFIPFVASVLLKAWKDTDDASDIDIILGGIASLNDEISWFKKEASKWDVPLSGNASQKPNQDYCRFLESLMGSDIEYSLAITAFWAIEAVYQESFSLCLEDDSRTPEELMGTCQRWGNEDFRQYCCSLCRIANRNLAKATEDVVRKAEEAFVHVLEKEVGFWNMSYGDS